MNSEQHRKGIAQALDAQDKSFRERLEAKDARIEELNVAFKSAVDAICEHGATADNMEDVVEAARNVQFKPQNDEPYLALQDTIKALDKKK